MNLDSFAASESDVAGFYAGQSERPTPPRRRKKHTQFKLPKHADGERFVLGPIPLDWLGLASTCGARSDAVAILLWYSAGWQKANPVSLTQATLSTLRVHPKTARRVLRKMADLGLVAVEFHRGRSPLVTLLSPNSKPSG